MFGNARWPWATFSRITTTQSPLSAILSQTTPSPSVSTTAPTKFHEHLKADDIDKLYDELQRDRLGGPRYTAPPGHHMEEAESKETWSYTLSVLIIRKLEEC